MKGKMMKQTRISFGKMSNKVDKGNNKGHDGNQTVRTMGE